MNRIVEIDFSSSSTLDAFYEEVCTRPSDIHEHIPVLRKYAAECHSVVEIGVRSIISTWGILKGLSEFQYPSPPNPFASHLPRKYTGIDLNPPPKERLHLANQVAREHDIHFRFLLANDFFVAPRCIGPCDMLFIDSMHTYCHLTFELNQFSHLAGKYLIMHDSSGNWEMHDDLDYTGTRDEYPFWYDRDKRGVWPAIEDFLQNHPEWTLAERLTNNNGLTILQRQQPYVTTTYSSSS